VTIPLVVDETLPAGTVEMRSPGHAPVRIVNVAPDLPDGEALDLPRDSGPLIAAMFGPAPGEEPPGTYVFRFPQEETDDDGNPVEGDAGPECVPFTIDRDAG
jgi:hypothetical protein